MAPEAGLEPATRRLTAGCSTIELLWNTSHRVRSLLETQIVVKRIQPWFCVISPFGIAGNKKCSARPEQFSEWISHTQGKARANGRKPGVFPRTSFQNRACGRNRRSCHDSPGRNDSKKQCCRIQSLRSG